MSDLLTAETFQENRDLPSENRVGGSEAFTYSCTGFTGSQVLETQQETQTYSTTTVSGIRYWLNRDPIGEHAFKKSFEEMGFFARIPNGKATYRFVRNAVLHNWDRFGLSCSTTVIGTETTATHCDPEMVGYQVNLIAQDNGCHCDCTCDINEFKFKTCHDHTVTTYYEHCEFNNPGSPHPIVFNRTYDGPDVRGSDYTMNTQPSKYLTSKSTTISGARFNPGCRSACSGWSSSACSGP